PTSRRASGASPRSRSLTKRFLKIQKRLPKISGTSFQIGSPRMKTSGEIEKLVEKAWEVRKNAYTPYYKYPVGSALLSSDGKIFVGCNVENVAGSVISCAEVTALGLAIAAGAQKFKAIAIAGPENEFLLPCGSCRQRLIEFSPD